MSGARDFLVELGTEELPPLALPELERAFAAGLRAGLAEAALSHGDIRSFATSKLATRSVIALSSSLGGLTEASFDRCSATAVSPSTRRSVCWR